MRLPRIKDGLPLAVWAGGLVGVGCVATLGVVTVGLNAAGRLDSAAVLTLIVALVPIALGVAGLFSYIRGLSG